MSDANAFAKTIRETPEERTNWLVFADWLDERGHGALANYCRTRSQVLSAPRGMSRSAQRERHEAEADLGRVAHEVEVEQIRWLEWELGELRVREKFIAYAALCENRNDPTPALRLLALVVITLADSFDLEENPSVFGSLSSYQNGTDVPVAEFEEGLQQLNPANLQRPSLLNNLQEFIGALREGSVSRYFRVPAFVSVDSEDMNLTIDIEAADEMGLIGEAFPKTNPFPAPA